MEKNQKDGFEFSHTLRVRYSEVDSQGIVFNANYLNYIDVAIGEYFRSKNNPYNDFVREHSLDFHVIRSVLDYRYGAHYDDELDIACARNTGDRRSSGPSGYSGRTGSSAPASWSISRSTRGEKRWLMSGR